MPRSRIVKKRIAALIVCAIVIAPILSQGQSSTAKANATHKKVTGSSPSLKDTMDFIGKMIGEGFAAYGPAAGEPYRPGHVVSEGDVTWNDTPPCELTWYERDFHTDYEDYAFYLFLDKLDISKLAVVPFVAPEGVPRNAYYQLVISQDPAVQSRTISRELRDKRAIGWYPASHIYFSSQSDAERTATAIRSAFSRCGGKRDPF